jgi:NO-binding membrane sensor protein with MHYT domain
VAEIHHFTYGLFTPVAAFLVAFLGSLLGLACTARARQARTRGRRTRWLVIAAITIGGAAIWLMHFIAMLGFEVPQSPTRYNGWLTLASLGLAILPVGFGLFLVSERRTTLRILGSGLFTGLGVLGMHYTGMLGMRVAGTVSFDPGLVGASAVIAVVAATVALWFTTMVRRWTSIIAAALVMAVAVCGMHYTGMAALHVRPSPDPVELHGISPFLMIVPITLVAAIALIGTAISALQAMTEEEFDGERFGRHRIHAHDDAIDQVPWTLREPHMDIPARSA